MAKAKKKSVLKYGSAKAKAAATEQGGFSRTVKLPENMSWWNPPKAGGKVKLEFAPYRVGTGNPFAEEGGIWYERTFYIHKHIGAEDVSVVCRRRTFAKPCPACDAVAEYKSKPGFDPDIAKEMEPKQRQLFLVKDLSQADKGWQLWDFSFHMFGKVLDNKVSLLDEDDPNNGFFYLDGGRQLSVLFKGKTHNGGAYAECVAIEFGKEREELDESVLDEVPCLDDLIIDLGKEKLAKMVEGAGDDENGDDDDTETKPKTKGKPKDEDDDDEENLDNEDAADDEDEGDDEDAETGAIVVGVKVKVKYKGKTVIGEVARVDEETERCGVKLPGVAKKEVFDFEDVTVVVEEEEEERPKKKVGKKPKDDDEEDELEFETEDEEEDPDGEDEEEDEDEEEEKPKKVTKKPAAKGGKPKKGRAFEEEAEEDDDLDAFDTEDEEEEERPKKVGKK